MHASTSLTTRTDTDLGPARPRRRRFLVAALAAPLLALAGCGGAASSGSASSGAGSPSAAAASPSGAQATYPVTVSAGNGQVTLATRPKAIVSLSPSLTEMLYAVGAGAQVKAVDNQSSYPAEAPRTTLSGFKPNAEAVAGYSPDLVVLSNDSNGLVASLTKLKIPVLLLPAPATLDDSFTQELTIGAATGHPSEAKASVEKTRQRVDAAVASAPRPARPLKIYHEIDPTYYSVTSKTFIGNLYARFGLQNIADSSPKVTGDYPQLSAEFVVSSAPDVIVLADGTCCQQSPARVAARPAFGSVPAVVQKKVIAIDEDIASRWGPRVADLAEALAAALRG
jgi:iron complex transport system substrate-binding protein